MAVPWLMLVLAGVVAASPLYVKRGPVPDPLPATPDPSVALPSALEKAAGHPLALGARLRISTTQGAITVVLFPAEAPSYTRHFLKEVDFGTFTSEGFWRIASSYVQLGAPDTDVDNGSGTHSYALMPTTFDHNRLPQLAGALVMDRAFSQDATPAFVRHRYGIVKEDGAGFPGTVIGQVIEGLDVARRLGPRDAIHGITLI
ncbi:MAG TPA: peptidylprolyl isomerase [Pantanalinema sp.]